MFPIGSLEGRGGSHPIHAEVFLVAFIAKDKNTGARLLYSASAAGMFVSLASALYVCLASALRVSLASALIVSLATTWLSHNVCLVRGQEGTEPYEPRCDVIAWLPKSKISQGV